MHRRTLLAAVLAATVAVGLAVERQVGETAQLAIVTLAGLALGGLVTLGSDGVARRVDGDPPSYRAVGVGVVGAAAIALGVVTTSVPFTPLSLASAILLVGGVTGWFAGTAGVRGAHAGSLGCSVGVLAAVPVAAVDAFSMRPALTWMPIWVGLLGPVAGVALGGVGGAVSAGVRRRLAD